MNSLVLVNKGELCIKNSLIFFQGFKFIFVFISPVMIKRNLIKGSPKSFKFVVSVFGRHTFKPMKKDVSHFFCFVTFL